LFSTGLARWVGPRRATCVSLPPSRPVRPQTPFSFHYRGGPGGCQPNKMGSGLPFTQKRVKGRPDPLWGA
jgi:hypothetical protein